VNTCEFFDFNENELKLVIISYESYRLCKVEMSSPEKLTIGCVLNILSREDKATLEEKVWKERSEKLWLAGISWTHDDGPAEVLVTGHTKKEAIDKLLEKRFWDFNYISLWDPKHKQPSFDSNQLPKFTKDMKVEDYWSIIKSFMVDKTGKQIYWVYIPEEYSIRKLSKIKTI